VPPDQRPTRATGRAGTLATAEAAGLEVRIEAALEAGRIFEAVDLARTAEGTVGAASGSAAQGLRWLAALVFMQCGDVQAARALADSLEAAPRRPVQGAGGERRARVLEALWQATGNRADLDRALEVRSTRARRGNIADAATAALLAEASGHTALAADIAGSALARHATAREPAALLDLARLALVVGDVPGATRALARLARNLSDRPFERSAVRRALAALATYGITVPPAVLDSFPPPRIVIYCGVRDASLDRQPAVREAIRAELAAVTTEIAYGSATAGADLLFAEAVLQREAELNLVLPCGIQAFRQRLVAPAGGAWLELFDRVIGAAASVTSVADDRQGLDQLVFEFGNRVIDGTARLRAERLDARAYLIAACDPLAESERGGVADFIDHWGDPARLRLVDLDEISADGWSETVGATLALPAGSEGQRIAGLLFADVVGFSRLDDALLPAFWQFMAAVANHMTATVGRPPAMRRSWGDALFVLADDPLSTADYAMALAAAVAAVDARAFGLPTGMAMRIALHAGPVFAGRHPLTDEAMVYGGNVNRAARIEPVARPGRVLASAAFVAWLTAEESAAEAETRMGGGRYRPRYRCTYRGIVELAKRYGAEAVYEVEPWRPETPMPEAELDHRRFAMTLVNDLAEHRRLAAAFSTFLEPWGVSEPALAPFEIAFDELLTNICRYAWTDAGQHAILVTAVVDGQKDNATVTVTIEDDGQPFDPLAISAPSLDDDLESRAMGGLGIHLVRELMDELHYARVDSRNRLTLKKRLATAPPDGQPSAAESVEER